MKFSTLNPFIYSLLLLLFSLLSCSDNSSTENVVKNFVANVEEAVEGRNARKMRGYISETYHDGQNRTKKDLSSIASGYILHNKNLHVLSRVTSFQQIDTSAISATILAAFTSKTAVDASVLHSMNADLYWFDLTLVKEKNDWRLNSVSWRQAMLDDFLN